MNWPKNLKGRVKLKEPLKKHTTFQIGGAAQFFIEPEDPGDLKLLLNLLKRDKIPFRIIGAGSNILVDDYGVNGAVLRLNSPYFKKAEFKGLNLDVGAGLLINRLVWLTHKHGLSGAEFLVGIPGTVGGALMMNAGISEKGKSTCLPPAFRTGRDRQVKSIGDLVANITVADYNGNIKTLNRKDIQFGYRESSLSKYIILRARLKLVKKDKNKIRDTIKKYLGYRKDTHDLSRPSAGCIFKNPEGFSAGQLIDLCGLKGKRIQDARVSLKHANFILNLGRARAKDVFKLMKLITKEVEDRFDIILKPEIKIWQ